MSTHPYDPQSDTSISSDSYVASPFTSRSLSLGSSSSSAPSSSSPSFPRLRMVSFTCVGHGSSTHLQSRDVTQWKDINITIELDWNGNFSFIGHGLSVLNRDCMGATSCHIHMTREKEADRELEDALDCKIKNERFVGPMYKLGNQQPREQIELIAPLAIVPSQYEAAAGSLRSYLDWHEHSRSYGSTKEMIAVPFIMSGHMSVKSGQCELVKTHYRYVWSHLVYRGSVGLYCRHTDTGQEKYLEPRLLFEQLVERQCNPDEPLDELVDTIRIWVESSWSVAFIEFKLSDIHQAASVQMPPPPSTSEASGPLYVENTTDVEVDAPKETYCFLLFSIALILTIVWAAVTTNFFTPHASISFVSS